MLPEFTLQLAGRVGNWHPRYVHTQARAVWAAWLHTAQYGLIGVYVLPKPNVPLAMAVPHRAWVQLQGMIRPLRVQALPDDPRVAGDIASTPLLVHAVQTARVRRTAPAPPLLPHAAAFQVRAGEWTPAGYLAPAAHLPDLYHLATEAQRFDQVRLWSIVRGVVATVGSYRFLRYIVTEERI
jgi:hypothetical protein